jgi:hypothetical protein
MGSTVVVFTIHMYLIRVLRVFDRFSQEPVLCYQSKKTTFYFSLHDLLIFFELSMWTKSIVLLEYSIYTVLVAEFTEYTFPPFTFSLFQSLTR